jgi:hypothetical protein
MQYVEDDEVKMMTTRSLNEVTYPLTFKDAGSANINCALILSFNEGGGCSISAGAAGYTANGSGKFVKKGEKKSWGDKDRDALYLNYTIDISGMQVSATDTLVLRNRGVAVELFNPVLE